MLAAATPARAELALLYLGASAALGRSKSKEGKSAAETKKQRRDEESFSISSFLLFACSIPLLSF